MQPDNQEEEGLYSANPAGQSAGEVAGMAAGKPSRPHWVEVGALFFKLGLTAFGGPAAHIGLMHNEVVKRRRWLTDQQFLDLLGATNLIPGPNSTEMAIHIGFVRAGWPGMLAGGAGFIIPAFAIVAVLAWMYISYGTTPAAEGILYGIKPVVIAIIFQALGSLGRRAVKGPATLGAALFVLVLFFFDANEILLLLVAGAGLMLWENRGRFKMRSLGGLVPWLLAGGPAAGWLASVLWLAADPQPFSLSRLFFTFFKIGSVLYGGGYVLLAFLQRDFVDRLGWLTQQQLLDAIAIGQVTPGPLFTSATFIGYNLGGMPGAVVATLGIFLPSFVFVAISNPFIPRLRSSPWFGALLDGVNAASIGLMAAVTLVLARSSLFDPLTAAIALISALLLIRYKINSTWLIAAGALVGLARMLWI